MLNREVQLLVKRAKIFRRKIPRHPHLLNVLQLVIKTYTHIQISGTLEQGTISATDFVDDQINLHNTIPVLCHG